MSKMRWNEVWNVGIWDSNTKQYLMMINEVRRHMYIHSMQLNEHHPFTFHEIYIAPCMYGRFYPLLI